MTHTANQIRIAQDAEHLAQATCQWIVQLYQERDPSGKFSIALSGGSTPRRLYQLLGQLPEGTIDWSDVLLIWGDERNVAPDHADSNFRMVREAMLDTISIPQENILAVPNPGGPAAEAATAYEATLAALPKSAEGQPIIDCVLLGIGDDVHTASLFPHTKALSEMDRVVVENWVEKLDCWRITLTAPAINAARNVAFLIAGEGKREALNSLWNAERNIAEYPSQLIQPDQGILWFLVDEAAVDTLDQPAGSHSESFSD
ncbi:MAG: 6-phosphogluconolactonase [Planctomycetota bacterium]